MLLRLGVGTVGVDIDDPVLSAALAAALTDLAAQETEEPETHLFVKRSEQGYELWHEDSRVMLADTRSRAADQVVAWCNARAVHRAGPNVSLHAAGLVDPDSGTGVLLPAESGAGKSTIAAALIQRGWEYLSDEMVRISSELSMLSYPKPITFKEGSRKLFESRELRIEPIGEHANRWYVRPQELGGHLGGSHDITHVVALQRCDDPTPELSPLAPADMLLHLALCTQRPLDDAGADLSRLAQLACSTACWRLEHGDLDPALDLISGLARQPNHSPFNWKLVAPPARAGDVGPRALGSAVVLFVGDGAVLHNPANRALLRLNASARAIWQELDGSKSEAQVASHLAVSFGADEPTVAADVGSLTLELGQHGFLAGVDPIAVSGIGG